MTSVLASPTLAAKRIVVHRGFMIGNRTVMMINDAISSSDSPTCDVSLRLSMKTLAAAEPPLMPNDNTDPKRPLRKYFLARSCDACEDSDGCETHST